MSTPSPYSVELADLGRDAEQVLELWERCGFGPKTPAIRRARYEWYYLRNPEGLARLYLLRHAAAGLIGTLGAGSRRIECLPTQTRTLRASEFVDFVVDPAHRSVFPALTLQRHARSAELERSDLIYGLPNAKAAALFRAPAVTQQFESATYVRVLRPSSYFASRAPAALRPLAALTGRLADGLQGLIIRLGKRASSATWSWVDGVPLQSAYERILADIGELAVGDRDHRFLAWRYAQPDQPPVRSLMVHDEGVPIGWFICRVHPLDMQVLDFVLPARQDRAHIALHALLAESGRTSCRSLRIGFGGCDVIIQRLRESGFRRRDVRAGFIIANPSQTTLPAQWWFTNADEDV